MLQGPYEYRGSYRPHGQQARDLTVFQVGSLGSPHTTAQAPRTRAETEL